MRLNGGIYYNNNGLTTSVRAMHLQSVILSMRNDNVAGFDKVGFQRKEPVVSSFCEYLGANALSQTVDDKVGRIGVTGDPLDVAIANKGYFQVATPNGIKLTRDGRFKLDKNGNLVSLEGFNVLSDSGVAIKLPSIPQDLKQIKIDTEGKLSVFDEKQRKLVLIGRIGVVDTNGIAVTAPNIKQGYNEYSNVALQEEFIKMMPIMKNFDANRHMFMLQNSVLGKAISQLSSAS